MISAKTKRTRLLVLVIGATLYIANLWAPQKPQCMAVWAETYSPSSFPPTQWKSLPVWTEDSTMIAVSNRLPLNATKFEAVPSESTENKTVFKMIGPRSNTYILDAKTFNIIPNSIPDALYNPSWSPNGRYLTGTATFSGILSYEKMTGTIHQAQDLRELSLPMSWAPDSNSIAIARSNGIEIRTPDLQQVIKTYNTDLQLYQSIDWAPDGKTISFATGRFDNQTTDSIFGVIDADTFKSLLNKTSKEGFGKVSFSKTGKFLAYGDKAIRVLDTKTLKTVRTLRTNDLAPDVTFEWSNLGDKLAYKGEDRKLHIIDIEQNREQLCIAAEKSGLYQYSWSPKDTYLTILSVDKCAVCDTVNGEFLYTKPLKQYAATKWFPDESALVFEKRYGVNLNQPPPVEVVDLNVMLTNKNTRVDGKRNPWAEQKVPLNLEDCLAMMPELMEESVRKNLKELPENETWKYEDTFVSMPIRNKFGLKRKTPVVDYFNSLGIKDGWSMSTLIIRTYWRKLNNKPLDIENIAAKLKASELKREAELLKNSTSRSN